jgi:hypothetical protein
MRKRFKNKKRACGLCKPFKRGWDRRWKYKEFFSLKLFEKIANNIKHYGGGQD